MSDPPPEVGDTYRAEEGAPVPAGYYQVVGREGETVTFLRIGDAAGRRRNTGRIESVDRSALDAFEAAEAPRIDPLDRAGGAGTVRVLWLSLRTVPGNLRGRPAQSLLGVALLVVAFVGPALVDASTVVLGAANLVGAVLLGFAAAGLPR